ncbi:MAG: GNAT family N-acetyltransferase [Clostridiales bacterium]|jgi:predicted acetyltransferase|nr:GNAT family N-acetyltransferase [Clostridiales bacterium]
MKRIVPPSAALRTAFYKMAYEYKDADDRRYYKEIVKDGFDYEDYVTRLHRYSLGIDLEEGLVPYTTFWMIDDSDGCGAGGMGLVRGRFGAGGASGMTIYGVSRLRHSLNEQSRKEGGHIGYDVPPSLRNAGNATELLRQTLAKAKAIGIMRVLMTCDAENAASARVIEKNGGTLENQVISDYTKKIVNRYWINC